MKIITYAPNERDDRFYGMVGPFAMNRSVTAELHDAQYGAIYDEPDRTTWFIAVAAKTSCVGFCALFDRGKDLFFDNTYVVPKHRKNGVGRKLFQTRLAVAKKLAKGRKIKGITKSEIQLGIYIKNGFRQTSKRGKYHWMEAESE